MPTHVRHVFLTGFPGVGKTTTMLKAIDELGKAADALPPCGFYTAELRDVDGKRCGFDVVTFPSGQSDARRAPLARLVAGDGAREPGKPLPLLASDASDAGNAT